MSARDTCDLLTALALMRRIADGCQPEQQLHLLRILQHELGMAAEDRLHLPMPDDKPLSGIIRRLVAKPGDDRDLSEWASEAGVTSRSLARYFKTHTNSSFVRWRSVARIMSSVPLLLRGQQVSSVSAAVGYEDTSAFIQLFKQTVGSSPRQYALGLRNVELALLPSSDVDVLPRNDVDVTQAGSATPRESYDRRLPTLSRLQPLRRRPAYAVALCGRPGITYLEGT